MVYWRFKNPQGQEDTSAEDSRSNTAVFIWHLRLVTNLGNHYSVLSSTFLPSLLPSFSPSFNVSSPKAFTEHVSWKIHVLWWDEDSTHFVSFPFIPLTCALLLPTETHQHHTPTDL